jgi:hypothetical protein
MQFFPGSSRVLTGRVEFSNTGEVGQGFIPTVDSAKCLRDWRSPRRYRGPAREPG